MFTFEDKDIPIFLENIPPAGDIKELLNSVKRSNKSCLASFYIPTTFILCRNPLR